MSIKKSLSSGLIFIALLTSVMAVDSEVEFLEEQIKWLEAHDASIVVNKINGPINAFIKDYKGDAAKVYQWMISGLNLLDEVGAFDDLEKDEEFQRIFGQIQQMGPIAETLKSIDVEFNLQGFLLYMSEDYKRFADVWEQHRLAAIEKLKDKKRELEVEAL